MSLKENKAVVLRFYKFFNRGEFDACNELISPMFISHRTTGDVSAKDLKSGTEKLIAAFPDSKLTI